MVGQINRGSRLGEIIYDMCKQDDVKTIVEIGTWNGMGSTKCIYDAIIESGKTDYLVYSLECSEEYYNLAVSSLPPLDNFNLLLGRVIDADEVVDIDSCEDRFFTEYGKDIQKRWLAEDVSNYNKVENVIGILPEKIDLLILDGGEFSSFAEFNRLKDRTKYFILDDINPIKNFKVSNIMREDDSYEILFDVPNDRNGFLVSKKNNI